MTMTLTKHWLVYRRNGRSPRHRHPSLAEAVAEARRLASLQPGCVFLVLEAVDAYRAVNAFGAVEALPLPPPAVEPAPPPPEPVVPRAAVLGDEPIPPAGEAGWRAVDHAAPPSGRVDAITRAGLILRDLGAAHYRWTDDGTATAFRLWRPTPEPAA